MPHRDTELESLADLQERIAAHARALAMMEREVTSRIERSDLFAVLVADTAIAEAFSDPSRCLSWLTASHRAWLRSNAMFNQMAQRPVFYRFILLPYPSLLRNLPKRRLLIDTILLHLHLQLWHGVVCGVTFLDPKRSAIADVLADLNFIAIPSQRTLLDTPAFYKGENLNTSILSGNVAERRMKELRRLLFPSDRNRPIWLHYDEANFQGERLRGWRWEALRAFFLRLHGRDLRCAVCSERLSHFDLDHLAPVCRGFFQTLINLRPTCTKCNREKGAMLAEDPFQLRIMLPEDLRTRELDDIQRMPPPWLGRLPVIDGARVVASKLGELG